MKNRTDQQLLAEYADGKAEDAFAELVRRHVDPVYSAALRVVGDPAMAQDVTQGVFLALAKHAGHLTGRPVLSGWLHRTARNLAANVVRSEVRRHAREREAASMTELLTTPSGPSWSEIGPHLDAALIDLSEPDRDAVMLRYFEKKSAKEMAGILGVSAQAAQKRVNRAVERLRELFAQRGVTTSVGALAAALSADAVHAAPTGLAAAIIATAPGAGAVTATTSAIATQAIVMTTLQKSLVTATVVLLAGTGIYQARQVSRLNNDLRALERQHASLTEESERSQQERDEARAQLARLRAEKTAWTKPNEELLRLRGMAGVARRATAEAEQLKAQLAKQAENAASNPVAGAMAQAMERQMEGSLSRMTAALQLNDEQVHEVRDILMRQAQAMAAGMQQAMSGRYDQDELSRLRHENGSAQELIKALLTPDQLAAYADYERAEAAHNASMLANSELLQMQSNIGLTEEQMDRAYAALYEVHFGQMTNAGGPDPTTPTSPADPLVAQAELLQQAMERKLASMEPILTEAQLQSYRRQQEIQLQLVKEMMEKMQSGN